MKKFLRNTLMLFLIIFFILSFINLISQIIHHYFVEMPYVIKLAKSVTETGISGEKSYSMLASVYAAGYGDKIEVQTMILFTSILLSISASLILTFEEKSKFKIICYYILGMITISLVSTIYNNLEFSLKDFWEELFYYLEKTWIWYTLGFIIVYIIKIIISSKKTKELNKILKNKQKSN